MVRARVFSVRGSPDWVSIGSPLGTHRAATHTGPPMDTTMDPPMDPLWSPYGHHTGPHMDSRWTPYGHHTGPHMDPIWTPLGARGPHWTP